TIEVFLLRTNWLRMPPGTENIAAAEFRPSTVRLGFDQVSTRLLPVAPRVVGSPPTGYELERTPEVDPPAVRAIGAARSLARLDSLRLAPTDLRERRATDTLDIPIDTAGTGLLVSPRTVRVIVRIRQTAGDSILSGITLPGGGGGR